MAHISAIEGPINMKQKPEQRSTSFLSAHVKERLIILSLRCLKLEKVFKNMRDVDQ